MLLIDIVKMSMDYKNVLVRVLEGVGLGRRGDEISISVQMWVNFGLDEQKFIIANIHNIDSAYVP